MILVFPVILVVLAVALTRSWKDGGSGATGWHWFLAWTAGGALFTFSFLTGFSVGLLVLPFAGLALFWVARRAPRLPEALGFVEGLGAVLLLVAFLNRGSTGLDPTPWLVAGALVSACALLGYGVLRARG